MNEFLCLDTNIYVKALVPEPGSDRARSVLRQAVERNVTLVAPHFCWAEVGSVFRKKVRKGELSPTEAETAYATFLDLPVNFYENHTLGKVAWEIADKYDMPTLYDAAFVSLAQHFDKQGGCTLITADQALLKQLGEPLAAFVCSL